MNRALKSGLFMIIVIIGLSCGDRPADGLLRDQGWLRVSPKGRFLQHEDGSPFFWQGDTGWLLFQKLDRAQAVDYLENRRLKGFNVIQVMLLHDLPQVNVYGDTAMIRHPSLSPHVTPGADSADTLAYDYWDHVDFILHEAADRGIYLAMVPMWGSIVKSGKVSVQDAVRYGRWLAERYRSFPNVIWINGGDVRGDQGTEIWQALGEVIHESDPGHLMTFHPFGRTQSSMWFHYASWLDFNMFQSGHRRYDQRRDTDDSLRWFGEDNWKYVLDDYLKHPPKPTIDGEPSYENIPQGLHDSSEPYWCARDVRRYAYWSVFAGSMGHTYGDNAVMQMHRPGDEGDYGVRQFWYEAVDDTGAAQIRYLKKLVLSRPYFERRYDPAQMADGQGNGYDAVIACRGESYAFFYTYTGQKFDVRLNMITGQNLKVWWMNPRTGTVTYCGQIKNKGIRTFDPRGDGKEGNDWVLILDDADRKFPEPGK
ncbi:glycoside hydrolase family 140 protein [bacterium]|nr:glycoside hydrolase family 140 protein [bacterium]